MYRNYMNRHCNCSCNYDMTTNPESNTETACSDVCNNLNMYYNECECGYDEYNVFPENPIFRSKLCSNSKNE